MKELLDKSRTEIPGKVSGSLTETDVLEIIAERISKEIRAGISRRISEGFFF